MKTRTIAYLCCTLAALLFGCGSASTQATAECPEVAPDEAKTPETKEGEPKVDAVSASSPYHFAKRDKWKDEQLIKVLKNHMGWTVDMFFAMATADANGNPNVASIMPYPLRDDVLIFANRSSITRSNIEANGFCHAIFRAVDPATADPKKFDVFGIVGSRIRLELIDDPKELDTLWNEYKEARTPISPPTYVREDHFFMKILKITPIG